MERYVRENQTRDIEVNPNAWWDNFTGRLDSYYFMFVAGHFKGNYLNQIDRIERNTGVSGAAVDIKRLLITANNFKVGTFSHSEIETELFVR